MKKVIRDIRYGVEAVLAYSLYGIFRCLPFPWASGLGGWLGRVIGPQLSVSNRARKNLHIAMPELDNKQREAVIRGMWDNLGRVMGELPHMKRLTGKKYQKYVEIVGWGQIHKAAAAGRGFIIFSGHLGNWELAPHTAAEGGYPLVLVYRPANNPWVNRLIRKSRQGRHNKLFPKGKEGAREVLKGLKNKEAVGMLVDQKMNEGIAIPFFGHDAMTAPAIAEFAKKFHVPLLPARVERLGGAQFRVTIYPSLDIPRKSVEEIMTEVNGLFESWIRERPEQWFWLHRRWPES